MKMNILLFSKRLKEIRTERKITQAEFAKKIGVSVNALSHYEAGKRIPASDVLYNICLFLGVSADELLGISRDVADVSLKDVLKAIVTLFNSRWIQFIYESNENGDKWKIEFSKYFSEFLDMYDGLHPFILDKSTSFEVRNEFLNILIQSFLKTSESEGMSNE